MSNILLKTIKKARGKYRTVKTKRIIKQIFNQQDELPKIIANAIFKVIANRPTTEEQIWVDKIESIRKKLNCSQDTVSIMDFGAGNSNNLSNKEIPRGEPIHINIGEASKNWSKSYVWAYLLFQLIREMKPKICLELGTCLGISTMYLASALKLNGVGKIVTLEGAEPLASIAIKNFKTLELNNIDLILGKFQDTLENVLVQQKFFDFVFIDGNHDENATIKYFNQIYPYLSEKAIVIFDDISWSQGMKNAWDTIQNDKKVNYAFNLHNIGICLFEPEGVNKSKKLYDMHIT